MTDETLWRLAAPQWAALIARTAAHADVLEDGAFVRAESDELHFYATSLNKPPHWRYPLIEDIPGVTTPGAFVGLAQHDPVSRVVSFDVILYAAVATLRADYESGVDDRDQLAYEQAVDEAARGTPADLAWLHAEFSRLVALSDL